MYGIVYVKNKQNYRKRNIYPKICIVTREEVFPDFLNKFWDQIKFVCCAEVERSASHLGKEDEYMTIEQTPDKMKMTMEFAGRSRCNEMNMSGETLLPLPGGHTKVGTSVIFYRITFYLGLIIIPL